MFSFSRRTKTDPEGARRVRVNDRTRHYFVEAGNGWALASRPIRLGRAQLTWARTAGKGPATRGSGYEAEGPGGSTSQGLRARRRAPGSGNITGKGPWSRLAGKGQDRAINVGRTGGRRAGTSGLRVHSTSSSNKGTPVATRASSREMGEGRPADASSLVACPGAPRHTPSLAWSGRDWIHRRQGGSPG